MRRAIGEEFLLRLILTVSTLVVIATTTSAGEKMCPSGESSSLFKVVEWTAVLNENDPRLARVSYSLESKIDEAIIMVEGTIKFIDVLGRKITGFPLNDDLTVAPREIWNDSWQMNGDGMTRLTKIDRSLVTVVTCVEAIATEAGNVRSF